MNVLVFAGTKNGRKLITALLDKGYRVYASSVSEYGTGLLDKRDNLITFTGQKSSDDIESIIHKYNISMVIDSTHPYAEEISLNINKVCEGMGIESIRFERKTGIPANRGRHFNSMEDVCKFLKTVPGNILFTTGVNRIPHIVNELEKNRIYVRILPVESSINRVEECGLSGDHVITRKPPFSLEENINHIGAFNIKYLVTKDSGAEGQTDEKMAATEVTGIELLVIDRPDIGYKTVLYTEKEILEVCERLCN